MVKKTGTSDLFLKNNKFPKNNNWLKFIILILA